MTVSIPSRRVGDGSLQRLCRRFYLLFPSPQGGSETLLYVLVAGMITPFPSPQGGSETTREDRGGYLSRHQFPSPQGGSETAAFNSLFADALLFPSPQGGSETSV